jgi:hypothetical protein
MSEKSQKTAFPVIPIKHWWALREKFKQSIPGVVTGNYLSSVLSMKVESAMTNILPSLKTMGIVDDDGKPTELAKKWRDDQQYTEICNKIKSEVYPKELLEASPNPTADRSTAERWFANHTGAGTAAVGKMVACYMFLCEADPLKVKGAKSQSAVTVQKKRRTQPPTPEHEENQRTRNAPEISSDNSHHPQVCINLQIHISADASTEQIDQIFASMAKHIYQRKL